MKKILLVIALAVAQLSLSPAHGWSQDGFKLPLLASSPAVPGLSLPAPFTVPPHKLTIIQAESTGEVRFLVVGTVPVEFATNGKSVVFAAPRGGEKVAVYAIAVVEAKLTEFARTEITVQDGAKPPEPKPVEPPTPAPKPAIDGKLHFTIIEDVQVRTPELARLLTSKTLRDELEKKNGIVRLFDTRDPLVRQKQLDTPANGIPLPVLIIQGDTGRVYPDGKALPLPRSEAEILKLVNEVTGR